MNKKKQTILVVALVLSLVLIISGVAYAFFNYTRQGTTDNTIQTGSITFLYTENSGTGRGISIIDAYPISDEVGKTQTGSDKMFDFKITSNTMSNTPINYEITARKSSDSTLDEDVVKLYLTKVNGTDEEEITFSKYSDLTQTTKISEEQYVEKILHTDQVPYNTSSYEENYRLRMWIDEETNFSGVEQEDGTIVYPYNDKTFKITVNVYANGNVLTTEEIEAENNANISTLLVGGTDASQTGTNEYSIELAAGTTSTEIVIETENKDATVEVERLDSVALETSNIKRLSTTKTLDLVEGENIFKITITSQNKQKIEEYILKIVVELPEQIIYIDEQFEDTNYDSNFTSISTGEGWVINGGKLNYSTGTSSTAEFYFVTPPNKQGYTVHFSFDYKLDTNDNVDLFNFSWGNDGNRNNSNISVDETGTTSGTYYGSIDINQDYTNHYIVFSATDYEGFTIDNLKIYYKLVD